MLAIARVVSFALLALSFFGIAQASLASRQAATNAERMARGLGPARPRRLYAGSRTNAARAAPSGVPSTTHTGIIALYLTGTSPSGGVPPLAWSGRFQIARSAGAAFSYTYTEPTPATAVLELECTDDPGYRLGGLPFRMYSSAMLRPGSPYYVQLNHVAAETPAGATEGAFQRGAYQIGYAFTTIFSVDPDTGKITVNWVNADGAVASPVYVLVYANGMYVTGDVPMFYSQTGATPGSVQVVDMYFVEQGAQPVATLE
ncbi:hypothetical protein OH77DRAFT_1421818 [Trametes cingulata]|nr:hypothetical protein OH77DRAFT_1421818 [Trametes cingulata]